MAFKRPRSMLFPLRPDLNFYFYPSKRKNESRTQKVVREKIKMEAHTGDHATAVDSAEALEANLVAPSSRTTTSFASYRSLVTWDNISRRYFTELRYIYVSNSSNKRIFHLLFTP